MNPTLANVTAVHAWKLPAFLRISSSRQVTGARVVEQPVQHMVKGSTVTVERALGHSVECLQGCLWITHDADVRDIVLNRGDCYLGDRNARMLVHALEPSISRFSAP